MLKKNLILIVLTLILGFLPLIALKNAEFAGADGLAEDAVMSINPDYVPWFEPLIELPSGEVESLLFSLQAAIGAGALGFILGRMTAGKKEADSRVQQG